MNNNAARQVSRGFLVLTLSLSFPLLAAPEERKADGKDEIAVPADVLS